MSYYTMYYGLLESKLFIILTKYISSESSDSRDSIFGGLFVIGKRNLDICDRKMHQKIFNGDWMAPIGCLAVCGITP